MQVEALCRKLVLVLTFLTVAPSTATDYPLVDDVATLDGIIKAYYEVVSAPAGQPRQTARDKSLHHPRAQVIMTGVDGDGEPYIRRMTLDEFHDLSRQAGEPAFFEREIHRETRRFGNIAHVWSTYGTRDTEHGPVLRRGINSIDLFHDGERWWITGWIFDGERQNNPIPSEFLPPARGTDSQGGAIGRLEQQRLVEPDNELYTYYLASAYAQAGRFRDSLTSLRRLIEAEWALGITRSDFGDFASHEEFRRLADHLQTQQPQISSSTTAFQIPEQDLFPESIAHDAGTGRFFLGSVYKTKIVQWTSRAGATDFIPSGKQGLQSVYGMKADAGRRILWVASNGLEDIPDTPRGEVGTAAIFEFDLDSGDLLARYGLAPGSQHELNDLCFDATGTIYVTDSAGGSIYRLSKHADALERLIPPGSLSAPNGIACDAKSQALFVSGSAAIHRLLLPEGELVRLQAPAGCLLGGIDGLYQFTDSLIGVQNAAGSGRVLRLRLNERRDGVIDCSVIESGHPRFRIPTTGVVVDPSFFYIANSQLDLLAARLEAEAPSTLQPTLVLRTRIDGSFDNYERSSE